MTRVLVVDNRDSFVHTLVDYLRELGADVVFVEADEITDTDAVLEDVEAVLVSPGPGTPHGASVEVVRAAAERRMPLVGVCLGHQAIAVAFDATVGHAPELMHGMVSEVTHDGSGLFHGIPNPFRAGRYHSLTVLPETLPDELRVTARTDTGTVMAIAHRTLPIVGVQFHPESVLTDAGHALLANWLAATGDPTARTRARGLDARHR